MILPGHVAASLLASRRLKLDLRVSVLAGLAPDLVDKFVFYVLHASRWTRVPAHSLLALAVSSLGVAAAARRLGNRRWGFAWVAGYSLHLLCDILPGEGTLPWIWPLDPYSDYVSPEVPWFLGGGPIPWQTLAVELALVVAALISEIRRRRRLRTR